MSTILKVTGYPLCFLFTISTFVTGGEPNPLGRSENFVQGNAIVCAVWYEDGWWVIRTTTNTRGGDKNIDARHVFTGKVRVTGGRITKYDTETLEFKGKAQDVDSVDKKTNGFDFRFVNFGGIDGIKFKVDDNAKSIEFDLKVDGDNNNKKIIIGSKGVSPEKAKFSLIAKPEK